MPVEVAERIRLVILTEEELRDALRLEAARQGMEMSELADSILRAALTDAIRSVREREKNKAKKKD